MSILTDLVAAKQSNLSIGENNLETGVIYSYSIGDPNNSNGFCRGEYTGFCWQSPGAGRVWVEGWGAGGSSSLMCCCGGSLPGNSGAYFCKVLDVDASSFVSGTIGHACANSDTLTFKGCSQPTCIDWTDTVGSGNACAQGGAAGYATCDPNTPGWYCCFTTLGFCNTNCATGCGLVCNYGGPGGSVDFIASATGGDVNCPGRISCLEIRGCSSFCQCDLVQHIPLPYGLYSTAGAEYVFPTGNGDGGVGNNGTYGPAPAQAALNALGNASFGSIIQYCYAGGSYFCTCYQAESCYYYAPIGTGGVAHTVCAGLRSHGFRGGPGAVRIRYVAD